MALYTLSKCILENLGAGKKYFTDLIFVFTSEANSHKIVIDSNNIIWDIYTKIAESSEFVSFWLQLMSHQPINFETIKVDLSTAQNDEECFLKLCSATKSQQKLIVFTHEGWEHFVYQGDRTILYNNVNILILDRDEAILELRTTTTNVVKTKINVENSVIATNNSSIKDSYTN